jgi:hypothetical protein
MSTLIRLQAKAERLENELCEVKELIKKEYNSANGTIVERYKAVISVGEIADYYPDTGTKIRTIIDGWDFDRHRTIEFDELLCDELYYMINPEDKPEDHIYESHEWGDAKCLEVMEAIIEYGYAGFVADW